MVSIEKLKSMMYELTDFWVLFEKYLDEVRRLQVRDETLIVSELDDTIFSCEELLKNEPLLSESPCEEERNKTAMYYVWVPHIIETYYKGKEFPQDIVSQMNPKRDFILTSWFESFQQQKANALGIGNIPMRIAPIKSEKVITLIQHILYEIKYIPKNILIYDSEPEDYIKYSELIESILGTKLTVKPVEMDENKWYKKI